MNADFAKALVQAQAEMPGIEKDSRNPHFRSEFVSLDHLLAEALPVLNRNGIALVQMPTFNEHGQPTLTTTLVHESGESLSAAMPLFLPKQDPQGQGSALTYARRYAAAAALGISSEKDDDANQAVKSQGNNKNVGEPGGAAAPEPDPAGAPPSPAPSPAEPELHSVGWWDALTPEQITALVPRVADPALLRDFAEFETNRRPRLGRNARRGVGAFLQARIKELEGEPEAGTPSPAVAGAATSVSQNGNDGDQPLVNAESAEPLQDLLACLAFIAEQPTAVDEPSFWTPTNVLVGLSTSGAGEFSALEEVPAEWLVKVLEKVPVEIREMVGKLGPEAKSKLAGAVA